MYEQEEEDRRGLRDDAGTDAARAGSAVVSVFLTAFVDTKAGQSSLARQCCPTVPSSPIRPWIMSKLGLACLSQSIGERGVAPMSDINWNTLQDKAIQAMAGAYSPYSRFRVGAA